MSYGGFGAKVDWAGDEAGATVRADAVSYRAAMVG
jgi:hypothetical protein